LVVGGWISTDLTAATNGPAIVSSPTVALTSTGPCVTATTAAGDLVVYSAVGSTWSAIDVTKSISGAPGVSGSLALSVTGPTITVSARAANWGDLFVYSNSGAKGAWQAVDASATGGSKARTVGLGVASAVVNGSLTLYAGGVATPAPTGTGSAPSPTTSGTTP
jgi:hypothetical protein